jgi:hypothetical protein
MSETDVKRASGAGCGMRTHVCPRGLAPRAQDPCAEPRALEEDAFVDASAAPADPASAKTPRSLRRMLPPTVDPELYEMCFRAVNPPAKRIE